MRLVDERERLLARLKMKPRITANLNRNVIDSRRDYEFGYRSIPFEKIADDYAKRLMPEVLTALVAKD